MNNNLNVNLTAQKSANNIKTILIMAFFVLVIGLLGYFLTGVTGNNNFLYALIFGSIITNIISYFFSDKIALSSAGAIPADENKYADLYTITRELCVKGGIRMPKIYIINDPAPNAFATGRNETHASVAVTTGLLALMNKSELEGVLAHELTHIKHKDILIMTVVVVLAGILSYMAHFAFSISNTKSSRDNSGVLGLIVGLVASTLIPFAAMMIQSAVSRKREFAADAGGALISGYAEGLASALEKIGGYTQGLQRATPATAHLYISNPFGASKGNVSFFQKLFMTHPPIAERIAVLRNTV
jgi:heat shock protein HtpX